MPLSSDGLPPIGRQGAAAALERLEQTEERAHARLLRALDEGDPFKVKAAQEFYLRASETLRRLDLAVETERRNAEEQIPSARWRPWRGISPTGYASPLLNSCLLRCGP